MARSSLCPGRPRFASRIAFVATPGAHQVVAGILRCIRSVQHDILWCQRSLKHTIVLVFIPIFIRLLVLVLVLILVLILAGTLLGHKVGSVATPGAHQSVAGKAF